jgi:hypothetical protein
MEGGAKFEYQKGPSRIVKIRSSESPSPVRSDTSQTLRHEVTNHSKVLLLPNRSQYRALE